MNVIRFQDLCIQGKVAGKRVFIRADLNVPQDASGAITEDTRIRASIPCIRMALEAGAAVMLTSHLGRPTEGQLRPEDSLAPVAQRLAASYIHERSPVSVALMRQMMLRNSAAASPLEAHRIDSLAMFYTSRDDGHEGVQAFLEKRPPNYSA